MSVDGAGNLRYRLRTPIADPCETYAIGLSLGGYAIHTLESDYLVIGSGAVSMAFVDTMLAETNDSFVIVDRHHKPGGHWNDAYSFVRLHQPSAFYGVPSTELGSNRIDSAGANKGYYELASGAEVSAYFDKVMHERFITSGRVRYFPMCDYRNDGIFRSLLSSDEYRVSVRKRTVDGTFFNTSVPSTHERKFSVDEDCRCATPNELPGLAPGRSHFTILGGGKTAMDTAVWLIESGANPDAITWVCPRDSWLIDRATTQPGNAFAKQRVGGFLAQLQAMQVATSVADLFERFEAAGTMLRIDQSVRPTMFHYATISRGEIDVLRQIRDVVREGRVSRIEADELVMENGKRIAAKADTLYVDCTATAVQFLGAKSVPVFAGDRITLQALTAPLVTTSAAIAAFVEATFDDDVAKNRLCTPVELADTPDEWLMSFIGNAMNQGAWAQVPEVRNWLAQCRLEPNRPMPGDTKDPGSSEGSVRARIGEAIGPAIANLQTLLADT